MCEDGAPKAPWNRGSHRGLDVWTGGEDTAWVREGCMHCSRPSSVSSLTVQKLGCCGPEKDIDTYGDGYQPHESRSSHPTPVLGTGQHLPHCRGTVRKPLFCLLPLFLSAACGKFTSLGAAAWRKVAGESPLLPQTFADAPRILGSGFSQDPCLLATWEFLCKIHTLFVFPSTQMEPLFG